MEFEYASPRNKFNRTSGLRKSTTMSVRLGCDFAALPATWKSAKSQGPLPRTEDNNIDTIVCLILWQISQPTTTKKIESHNSSDQAAVYCSKSEPGKLKNQWIGWSAGLLQRGKSVAQCQWFREAPCSNVLLIFGQAYLFGPKFCKYQSPAPRCQKKNREKKEEEGKRKKKKKKKKKKAKRARKNHQNK